MNFNHSLSVTGEEKLSELAKILHYVMKTTHKEEDFFWEGV